MIKDFLYVIQNNIIIKTDLSEQNGNSVSFIWDISRYPTVKDIDIEVSFWLNIF